jgi:hypothetical protein
MKKIFSLVILMAVVSDVISQQVPQGMKYQAVARNLKGEILADEKIVLKISLTSQEGKSAVVHYSELHNIKTNGLGLFTLVIGEGVSNNGFKEIPWSTQNIWMEVSIADKEKGRFTVISSSKLLAVPYAFHSETANRLTDGKPNSGITMKPPEGGGGDGSGTDAQVWQLFGNMGTNSAIDKLGTTDATDFRIVTNNVERMRVLTNGNVNMVNDLNVGKNVNLNTTSGATINNGNFTVANQSSTYLSGSLTADKLIRFTDGTQSNSSATGALVVTGGVGIEKNLNVGGDLNVAGVSTLKNLTVEGVNGKSVNITNNTTGYLATFINTNTDNGANAGDGIKIQLGKEKALDLGAFQLPTVSQFLPGITGAISNSIFTDGAFNTSLTAETFFNNLYAGATSDVLGYAQILEAGLCKLTNIIVGEVNKGIVAVNDGLSLPYNLATPINNALGLPKNLATPINSSLGLPLELNVVELFNNAGEAADFFIPDAIIPENGITFLPALPAINIPAIPNLILPAIPAIPTIPNCPPLTNPFNWNLSWPTATSNPLTNNNEFIGFFDNNGEKVGAIRGQSLQDFIAEYTDIPHLVDVAATLINGFDVDAGTPDPFSVVRIGARAFNYFIQTWDKIGKIGVEYSSGNGDYAEWLERLNPDEVIGTGDIIAVKGGKITKDLTGAEQIMAVSHRPIVLGNVPVKEKTALGNNIAFMGQIPVKVMGPVKAGDYIVAKSEIPGYGVAVDPLNMRVEDYKLTVGRSWTTDAKNGLKMVNTVVGVHNNNFLDIIKDLKEKTEENDLRLRAIEAKLDISSDSKINVEKKTFK